MRMSGVRAIMEGTRGRGSADAFWLARREMRKAWPSYVLGASIVSFSGAVAAVSLSWGVTEFEAAVLPNHGAEELYGAFFADYIFLLVCALLGANTLLIGYYSQNWRDASSSRLPFLGDLPISAGALVGGRALCMLFTLALSALAFFVPVYLFSDLGEEFGTGTYLAFCGLWVGYGLLGAGLLLLLGFGVDVRAHAIASYAFAIALMVAVLVLDWTAEMSLVERTAQLARGGYGTPTSIFSILAGGAAFVLLARATARHVRKRRPLRGVLRANVDA
jgi:hypothetical protein